MGEDIATSSWVYDGMIIEDKATLKGKETTTIWMHLLKNKKSTDEQIKSYISALYFPNKLFKIVKLEQNSDHHLAFYIE